MTIESKSILKGDYFVALKTLYLKGYPFELSFTQGQKYFVQDFMSSSSTYYLVSDDSGVECWIGDEYLLNFMHVPSRS